MKRFIVLFLATTLFFSCEENKMNDMKFITSSTWKHDKGCSIRSKLIFDLENNYIQNDTIFIDRKAKGMLESCKRKHMVIECLNTEKKVII